MVASQVAQVFDPRWIDNSHSISKRLLMLWAKCCPMLDLRASDWICASGRSCLGIAPMVALMVEGYAHPTPEMGLSVKENSLPIALASMAEHSEECVVAQQVLALEDCSESTLRL